MFLFRSVPRMNSRAFITPVVGLAKGSLGLTTVYAYHYSPLSHLAMCLQIIIDELTQYIFIDVYREGNHSDDFSRLTYRKLLEEVCRFANVLKMHGVNKGDRVSIYMPMVLELPIAMLACARIGAVHSIVVSCLD